MTTRGGNTLRSDPLCSLPHARDHSGLISQADKYSYLHPGIIGSVATQVERRIPGSDSEAVSYPATLYSYTTSQRAGTRAMTQAVQSYAQRCPNTKLVLMGYSQVSFVSCSPGSNQEPCLEG